MSQDLLISEFKIVRDGIIRSALDAIGQQLRKEGDEYEIKEVVNLLFPIITPYGSITLRVG